VTEPASPHTDVAAYALDLLDGPDRVEFERHLAGCVACAAELDDLAATRDVVRGVDADQVLAALAVPDPVEPAAPVTRPAPRRLVDSLVAAALVLVGLVAGLWIGGDGPASDHEHQPAAELLLYGDRYSASDRVSGATGIIGIESRGFGTHVAFELRGVTGPLTCRLVAVSTTGAEETAMSWNVPPDGYGVPSHPEPLVAHGGTSFPPDRIDRFEVRVAGGPDARTVGNAILTVPLV
jgi:hypothetical protein